MKRKYIKPTTSLVRVETQGNYCAAISGTHVSIWSVRDASGEIKSDADRGNVYDLTEEDERVSTYNPWNSDNW